MTIFVKQIWPAMANCSVIFCCAIKTAGLVLVIVSGFKDVGC
jgi:hypothetical protein